jgi:hypothetical protein
VFSVPPVTDRLAGLGFERIHTIHGSTYKESARPSALALRLIFYSGLS